MKVLHVIDHLGSGGAQTALLNLLRHGDRAHFEYTVAAMHGHGAVADEFAAASLRVLSLSPQKWPPRYFGALWQLLRAERFDIVHCHLFGANWLAKPLARLAGCRVLFSHDQCNDAFRTDSRLVTTIDAATNTLSTRILCVSRTIVDYLRDHEHLAADRLVYFPNSVDVASFPRATAEDRTRARTKFHLPADALIVGGVGRLAAQKDFPTFLQAAALVRVANPAVHFVIFGEGPDEAALREQARSLGLADHITFAGYASDRLAIYHALDALFLTSLFEGTPMVLLEAMAAGVPIAASRIDGSAEILEANQEALFFPPSDIAAAALALKTLLASPVRRAELAAAALAKVSTHFNAATQMQRLELLYREACSPA